MTIPKDSLGIEISVGDTVLISNKLFYLHGYRGVVMDLSSLKFGSLGPIAVFFDNKVPAKILMNEIGAKKWQEEGKCSPTPKNYMECPRIVCFHPNALTVIPTQ